MSALSVLQSLGLTDTPSGAVIGDLPRPTSGAVLTVRTPIDGAELAQIATAEPADVAAAVAAAQEAFLTWRLFPAPQRGELVRRIGNRLRERKRDLAQLVTLEAGKIVSEAEGEVQEMVDICDFAVGLSRQLHGLTIASERPQHRMMEQWHPLGPIGVITAFNFPVAVWAWNAMLAFVCGDSVVWKPSEKTPLCALATQLIVQQEIAASRDLDVPAAVSCVVIGDGAQAGAPLAADARLPLVSATGSVRMGAQVAQVVAQRLGRSLLELGGNNGMILTPSADRELALRAITFAAFGTAGQRCTSLRRLIVAEPAADEMQDRLVRIADKIRIGDPRQPSVLMGPLIDEAAWVQMRSALDAARSQGGRVLTGGERMTQGVPSGGIYVRPTIVAIGRGAPILQQETFAPILYVIPYRDLEEAIAIHNDVPQGLSSAIFTSDMREAERFLGPAGSDCGIANVNIGTSGAEIGGAFGGEKQTGGGRESGSDAWKNYMRRVTNTVNYGSGLLLAQGVSFDV